MSLDQLGLHNKIWPALEAVSLEIHNYSEEEVGLDCLGESEVALDTARDSAVFDCRGIDSIFIKDTGDAVLEEIQELGKKIRLPFNSCYFEFGDGTACLATEIFQYNSDLGDGDNEMEENINNPEKNEFLGVSIEIRPFEDWKKFNTADEYGNYLLDYLTNSGITCVEIKNFIESLNGYIPPHEYDPGPEFYSLIGFEEEKYEELGERSVRYLAAIISLLEENLVTTIYQPDPCPPLNKKRAKKGKTPAASEKRVVTLNTPALLREAKKPEGTHESPRLHWRRGHWRVLDRGTPEERKTWVKRTLVGDPEKGFIHKDYRVVFDPPMLEGAPA